MDENIRTIRANKTLETAREATLFAKRMLSSSRDAVAAGKPIGWSVMEWWLGDLLPRAMGVELIYPENYGALCAAMGKAEAYMEYAEMDGVPGTTCSYARNCIGYVRCLKDNDYVGSSL